jgi:hypothetical protein
MPTTLTDHDAPAATPSGALAPGAARHRHRRKRWIALAIVLALLTPVAYSYTSALTGPGTDALSIRSVEWLRTHHLRWLVDDVENYWYTHHAPKKGGLPSRSLQEQVTGGPETRSSVPSAPRVDFLPAPGPVPPYVADALPGEGQWRPLGTPVEGVPAMFATYLRPDGVYTSLVAAVAWIDPKLVRAVGYAGAVEPGGSGWPNQLPIPDSARPALLAAFNSGFKMQDSQGGYYDEGRYARPLRAGAATLWIDSNGTPDVGEWGRDVSMNPGIVFARQNLDLIVDGGQPVPGLQSDNEQKWGFTVANKVMVWRSGLGVTADGALLYAAGPGLSVATLADLLARAGAVRAMELDINTAWVDFFTYSPAPPGMPPADLTVSKLLVDMEPSTSHYLTASSRDCIALFGR